MEIRLTFNSVSELAEFTQAFNTLAVPARDDEDWPGPDAGKPATPATEQRPPWEPDDGSTPRPTDTSVVSASHESDSKGSEVEDDPWDTPSDPNPAQTGSAPAADKQYADDDPWS